MSTPDFEAEARKLFKEHLNERGEPMLSLLIEPHVYHGIPAEAVPLIASALQRAYDQGREDALKVQPMTQDELEGAMRIAAEKFGWGRPTPERIELGCDVPACFCTGRCKRTPEEQTAHEKREREGACRIDHPLGKRRR